MAAQAQPSPAPPDPSAGHHYRARELAPGCFVAQAGADGRAGANSTIVDLGERTLLVDCGLTPDDARGLCALAMELTGRPVTVALNTHYHSDHTWGNRGLPANVELYATAGTRQLLQTAVANEVAWYRATVAQEGPRTQSNGAHAASEAAFYEAAVAEANHLSIRLPSAAFERRITLYGSRRQVDLITHGGGHTRSDAVLWVADAALLVTGDLVTAATHPWLGDGNTLEWLRILAALQTLQPALVIPGHGPAGDGALLGVMDDYLHALLTLAEGAPLDEDEWNEPDGRREPQTPGETEAWLADVSPPPHNAGWAFASFFAHNLRHEVRRLYGGKNQS